MRHKILFRSTCLLCSYVYSRFFVNLFNFPDDPLSWQQINCLPLSCRVHGRCPPQSKSECEVIMMVGLPGAGKTYFAEQQRTEHREKQYNILGTNLILDKMKVSPNQVNVDLSTCV